MAFPLVLPPWSEPARVASFGVPPPRFVADVAPKIRDVMQTNVVSVPPQATVAEALGIMDEKNIRVLPILNDDRRVIRGHEVIRADGAAGIEGIGKGLKIAAKHRRRGRSG